jgi:phosphoribosylformimino-5-aminoimidazole carboxamide ribotide isomerase
MRRRVQVIPVVDLKNGVVVRAQRGDRAAYRPIETPLAATSDAVDVVRGLLALHAFRTLYVADLDAIMTTGDNLDAIRRIRQAFPALDLWIDNGAADVGALDALSASKIGAPVIGSESQRDGALLSRVAEALLSLDFRGDAFLGPLEILERPELWPQRIIVMTLARVGSAAGPDIERLAAIRAHAGARMIYAAGGVRDIGDLAALKASGIGGALVATALHDGRLTAEQIAGL